MDLLRTSKAFEPLALLVATLPLAAPVAAVLLASVAPAMADEWVSFAMGEGPDLKLERSNIRRDSEAAIAPWGKGWMTAKTERSQGG